jgi:hypothetical protein
MSNTDVLLIATMDGAENCARLIGDKVGSRVAVAPNKREGLSALRQSQFAIVMVQESLMEADPVWSDLVWELAGSAISVQVNFAISGCNRLAREVKAALMRQDGERAAARRAAVTAVKSSVTSLLLESELALREPAIPASLEPKLRHLVELAGALRERLRGETDSRG